MKKILVTFFCIIGTSVFIVPLVLSATIPERYKVVRILFTGNSVQFYSTKMDILFENLTSGNSDLDSTIFICTRAAIESSSLEGRLGTFVQDSVENGGHDYVILQEAVSVPENYPDYYYTNALIWDSLVRANGAEPIHWLNYPPGAGFEGNIDDIKNITIKISKKTGSKIAPVGLAWQYIIKNDLANQSLLYLDNWHPTPEGSYLNACMVYSTITGKSPVGLADLVNSSSYFQNVAWEIYQDYQFENPPPFCETVTFSATAKITNTYSNNGAIDQTVVCPQNVTHNWETGELTEDISGLESGLYTDKITMADSGCILMKSYTVKLLDQCDTTTILIDKVSSIPDTTIDGVSQNTGALAIKVRGGDENYTYLWSNGKSSKNISGLSSGSYAITVNDGNGCTGSNAFTVSNYNPCILTNIIIDGSVIPDTSAKGVGAIDISVTGGNEPYIYSWSNGQTTQNISGLTADEYIVTVSDKNSCSSEMTFVVKNISPGSIDPCDTTNLLVNGIIKNETYGKDNGAIDISVSGGSKPYIYNWNNDETSEDILGLSAGTYSVVVVDTNKCFIVHVFSVENENPCDTIDIKYIPNLDQSSFEDNGENNGSIILQSVEGGQASYSFLWSDGSTEINRSNLDSGYYSIQITDVNGCVGVDTFHIRSVIEETINVLKELNAVMNVDIYPNPTSGIFNIKVENNIGNTKLEIFSTTSTKVYSEMIDSNSEIEIDLGSLGKGIYILRITNSENAKSYKFIKQ